MINRLLLLKLALFIPPLLLVLLSIGGLLYTISGIILLVYIMVIASYAALMTDLTAFTRFRINKSHLYAYTMMLLVIVCYTRGVVHGTIDLHKAILLTMIWLIIVYLYAYSTKYVCTNNYIWLGIIYYIILNFIMWAIGISAPINAYSETGDAKIMTMLGFNIKRVQFPITLGINGFGIIAGLGSILSLVLVIDKKNISSIIMFITCVLVMLMTDSRGGLIAFLLSLTSLMLLMLNRIRTVNKIYCYFCVLLYPVLSIIFYSIAMQLMGVFSGISRGGGILSGRDVIWSGIFDFYRKASIIDILFGFGYFGQTTSGVSKSYSMLFEHLDNLNAEQVNVHSSFFQLMLDMGIIGVLILIIILIRIIHKSLNEVDNGSATGYYGIVFVIYCIVAGATDLTYNQNNLIVFSALLGLTVTCNSINCYGSKIT